VETLWDEELESHLCLGDMYLAQRRYDTAAIHYGTVLSISPDSEQHMALIHAAAIGMGRCFLAIGDVPRALEFFKQADSLLRGRAEPRPEPKEPPQSTPPDAP
jgi:tetratricopeptide (TPR) repeat protein